MKLASRGFPKASRILRRGEYRAIQRSPLRVTTHHFIVYGRRRRRSDQRIGITVSRKVGNAVARNRVKRWVREAYRNHRECWPRDLDFVFVARRGRYPDNLEQIVSEMSDAICRIKLLQKKRRQVGTANVD